MLPFLLLHVGSRLLSRRGYARHLGERFGFLPESFRQTKPGSIWLHAVSVGEVSSLLPLLAILRQRLPDAPLYLSTSTTAGRQIADKQALPLLDGLFFLPFDLGACLRRAFRTIRPSLLVVVETEVWPNLFATAHASGTPLALINGRISDRTWPTYRKWKRLFQSLLAVPDLVQVQSRTDRERYSELGVPASALLVEANLKYDALAPAAPIDFPVFDAEWIWIAASTVGPNERGSLTRHAVDEDDIVLAAFRQVARQFPKLLLVLAPRQPARFDAVAAKLEAAGVRYTRRSADPYKLVLPGVVLLDTMGELSRLYALANVVFVGGSLAPRGGHNVIEPAAAGVPVIVGPHMHNFEAIARNFLEAKALIQIETADKLAPQVLWLLSNPAEAKELGLRGQLLVKEQHGVAARTCDRLVPLYHAGTFHPGHGLVVQTFLNGLAKLWVLGSNIKRRLDEQYASMQAALPVPVISVGGLGVGGVGKTPFTMALAKLLHARGYKPGILTRGYRRRSNRTVIAGPGEKLTVSESGDEAQIFLRSGIVPLGIGANRLETGRLLRKKFPETDILLLDDGFQHAKMQRTRDVVLVDGLDPFGNFKVIPAGRLREPVSALARAHMAVITRCPSEDRFKAIAKRIRKLNPSIAIFRGETKPGCWCSAITGDRVTLPLATKALAFCGLGNPNSFWQTLEWLGVNVAQRRSFADHHRYTFADIQRLAAEARSCNAEVLVTTEKDMFNLPIGPIPIAIFYLPIELVVKDEDALLARLLS